MQFALGHLDEIQRPLAEAFRTAAEAAQDDPRRIAPTRSHLQSRGRKLLQTTAGPLDLLATIETATTFEDLLPDSDWLEVDGARFRVLSLARLIVVKEKLNRAKDQAMLVLLRATLDELEKPLASRERTHFQPPIKQPNLRWLSHHGAP